MSKVGTPVLDTAIYPVLETWETMEEQLEDAMTAAPYHSESNFNEWGHIMAVKFLIRDQIHLLQQQMTTHDRDACVYCQEERRDAEEWERTWKLRMLREATL